MRNTRKRKFSPAHFETLEARRLLSASVASTVTPLSSSAASGFVISESVPPPTFPVGIIDATTGESFTALIATLPHLSLPGNPVGTVSGPFVFPADTAEPTTGVLSISIDWGDHSFGTATLVSDPEGGYDVYGTHTYFHPGTYHLAVDASGSTERNPAYTGSEIVAIPASISLTPLDTQAVATVTGDPVMPPIDVPPGTFTPPPWQPPSASAPPPQIVLGANIAPVQNEIFAGYLGTIDNVPFLGSPDLVVGGSNIPDAIGVPDSSGGTGTESQTLMLVVNWGDGTIDDSVYLVANGNGGYDVYGHHTYTQAANYPILVSLSGSATPSPLDDGTFLPGPAAFQLEFQPFARVSAAGDSTLPQLSAPNGIFNGKIGAATGDGTVGIDWGDGSADSAGALNFTGSNSFDVYGSHNYAADGTYLVTVFSRESHTIYFAQMTVTGPISSDPAVDPVVPVQQPGTPVDPAPVPAPPVVVEPIANPIVPIVVVKNPPDVGTKASAPLKQVHLMTGQKFSGVLATTSILKNLTINQNKLTIHWGDGTTTAATASHLKNGTWSLPGTHGYKKAGHYTITVTWGESVASAGKGQAAPTFVIAGSLQLAAIVTVPPPTPARGHR